MFYFFQDPEVVHAPLPAFHQQLVCDRSLPMMHPLYDDHMDASMKGMEPESTSSLDDLLRPLDADYQHPVSVHQNSSPCNSDIEHHDSNVHPRSLEQSVERDPNTRPVSDQGNIGRHTGGAIPKCRKSWHSTDINEDESSSLLASDLSDTKHISSDFSDSVDSGKSSLDSSKSKPHDCHDLDHNLDDDKLFDANVLLQNENSQNPVQCEMTKNDGVNDNTDKYFVGYTGGSSSPSKPSDKNYTPDNDKARYCKSATQKPPYENVQSLSTQVLHNAPSRGSHGHLDGRSSRQHNNVMNQMPTGMREKQEKGDSGIEVDLRQIKKSH
jgi:hypothetical protein